MQRLPRGVYTKEFREQAVRLVLEEGLPIPQAGQRLLMSPGIAPKKSSVG